MSILCNAPISKEQTKNLKAGDSVLLSGVIYTGRDAAHKRMVQDFEKTGKFPFDVNGEIIYYVGPCPAKPGEIIGSCGPTTSGRMDAYAPLLIEQGLVGMIGKGERNSNVIEQMKKSGAVYFGALGGAGTLIAQCVKSSEVVAYSDLGAEAIFRLTIENLPLIVIIDSEGNNYYEIGKNEYRSL